MQIIFDIKDKVQVELTEDGAKKYNSEMISNINLFKITDEEKVSMIQNYIETSLKMEGSILEVPFWHLTQIFGNIKDKNYFKDDKIKLQ